MGKSIRNMKQVAVGAVVALFVFLGVFTARDNMESEQMAGAAVAASGEAEKASEQSETSEAENASADVAERKAEAQSVAPREMEMPAANQIGQETLWLARVIYSETKQPREQELVAWTVRNRVETQYRGNDSYRSTVLDPYQYSAFNPGNDKRAYYTSLTPESEADGWQKALAIAHHVQNAPSSERPFAQTTRHFYSERSMVGGAPDWARGEKPVKPERNYNIEAERFRFYEGIA